MYELVVEAEISAAHRLRGYSGECEKLHGHNWKVEVTVEGEELDSSGLLIDFHRLRQETEAVTSEFDHAYLNELPRFRELNPTTENLARLIFDELSRRIGTGRVRVSRVRVWEGEGSSAIYSG